MHLISMSCEEAVTSKRSLSICALRANPSKSAETIAIAACSTSAFFREICANESKHQITLSRGHSPRNILSVTRGATSTFGTGMKLLDESAETRIGLPRILRVGGVHKLVAVVVHLHSAVRANHLVSIDHTSHPCLRRSTQRYLLTTLA